MIVFMFGTVPSEGWNLIPHILFEFTDLTENRGKEIKM
jgi:hypothetical protein